MAMHPSINADTGFVMGPFVVVVTQTPPPGGGETAVQVVAPEGGFKTKEDAIEFSAYWAGVLDAEDPRHENGVFGFQILVLRDLGSFKQFMSF